MCEKVKMNQIDDYTFSRGSRLNEAAKGAECVDCVFCDEWGLRVMGGGGVG